MSILDSPGRFGTIQLLRQRSATSSSVTDIEHVITSFGVDSQTVSFGRDTSCSVRLYYPDVDAVHARIVFNQDLGGKAFLEVLGESGVRVDGCLVYPSGEGGNTSGSGGNGSRGGSPRTIALGDKSELEIHGKRFRFVYPPKEIRKQLAATPPRESRPGNRALRLSMIASAQVFSPRPSADPVQNLRILQSPLRAPFGSPSSRNSGSRDDNEEEEKSITLVQGSQPRVVEEAADLVILEDVVLEAPLPALNVKNALVRTGSSADLNGQQERGRTPGPPRTPRRQSLHRAVLIRSAQRAKTDTDSEGEGEESDTEAEEAEVRELRLEVVSVSSGSDVSDDDEGAFRYPGAGEDDGEEPLHDHDGAAGEKKKTLGWRKSLEKLAIWPFGRVKKEVGFSFDLWKTFLYFLLRTHFFFCLLLCSRWTFFVSMDSFDVYCRFFRRFVVFRPCFVTTYCPLFSSRLSGRDGSFGGDGRSSFGCATSGRPWPCSAAH
ncbi:hypothetical protein C8R43DRAFT_897413 [Mycena crocata]|nr:hypothetical protein C8R43DRAFT_897413 [Mycena crocata]